MSMEIPAIPISRFLKAMASAQGAGSDLDAVAPVVEWWNANAPAGLRTASSFMFYVSLPDHQGATERWASGLPRSEEHTSELQSLMRISYAVFCLKKKNRPHKTKPTP